MRRMTACFPALKNSIPTLANCFRKGGSQVQWEKTNPTPCFFRTSKTGVNQIGLGAKLDVVALILRDLAEEFVQILGKFGDWDPVVLDVVFLLEDDSMQAGAEDLNGGLIELLGENIRIQVIFVLNKSAAPPQFPGDDDLRGLEEDQIPLLHLLAVAFEDMEIRGGASLGFQEGAIKGVIDFQDGKVLKIFRHALDRQGFLGEGLVPDLMAPAGNPVFISALGINLPDPPGIPVAGRPDQDVLGEVAEKETFCPAFGGFSHNTILSRGIKRKHQQCRGEEGFKSLEDRKQAFS